MRKLAEIGAVTLIIDHKWILGRQGDPENKALGIVAVIACDDGTRFPITLAYLPTNDAAWRETNRLVEETLKKYDLFDMFLKLQIPFVADALLRGAVERLFTSNERISLRSICTDHNFTNLGKRAMQKMYVYLGNDILLKQLDSTLQEAEKAFAAFFKNKEVELEDREFIGQIQIPNWESLTIEQKAEAKLKYEKIPKLKAIRFRNPQERTQALLTWMPLLRRIQVNKEHELHSFVEKLPIAEKNQKFIEAVHKLQTHLLQQIDYYEGNNTFQSTDSLNSMIFCFQFALDFDRSTTCQYEVAAKMSLFDCLCEQLFSHTAEKTDSGYIWEKNSVPTRIGRLDKIGMFAFRSRQDLTLKRLSKMLKTASKKNRQFKAKFDVSNTFFK